MVRPKYPDPISDRSLVKEVLFLVNNLFKKFSELGYFLRGGIDYGWMLDEKDLALGNPLATAYQIESKYAIYPRIVISEAFKDLLEEEGVDFVNLIRRKCEIYYINPFYSVVQSGDKIEYFKEYKKLLEKTIKGNQKKEQVYIKYEWLVREFNWFLGQYTKFAGLIEPDIELESDEIKRIKRLKIKIS
ncbi:hypothetical protein A33Q_1564 [Indibacter alkaliphilus LW1]|uniref:Uncharacterized protein n=1 Tax=Indibacter alkaliphilus (strain CCUG 57479 / KCTC 22604 / LW1) TaxID=1189612 RepID=S2DFL8_INDAL|nr:hypothetical protein A33Q_1564 [Indibacter alkaliphilus LW1]